MNRQGCIILTVVMLMMNINCVADSVPMRDYNLLTRGMTEAEILYRLGPYDHETVSFDHFLHILHKTWYYIPAPNEVSNRQWITEIRFNGNGEVIRLERYKR